MPVFFYRILNPSHNTNTPNITTHNDNTPNITTHNDNIRYDVLTAEANMSRAGEFDGIDEVNLALLPPPSEGAEANATAWGSGYAMGGGLTSNKLLPSLASMDPNDPR